MKNKTTLIGILLLFVFSTPGAAADKQKSGDIPFPKEVRALIIQEMQALQQGMREIIPAIVSGNWSQLEKAGRQMRDSYIMKQKLTQEQKTALHATLPKTFKEVDKNFHRSAELLSKAAEQQDMEMVIFHYSKITAACVNCHSQHARHRFPALATTRQVTTAIMSECSSMRRLAVAMAGGDISDICGELDDDNLIEEVY